MQDLLKSEAIVLRINPFGQTSHMVTWLTRDYGMTTTSIKGACRPKSAFLGQYDLAQTCELVFYTRSHENIHAARECFPLAWREYLHGNWRAAMAAAYLCDLTHRVLQPAHPHPELFAALDHALDALATADPIDTILAYELTLLKDLGYLPHIELCPECEGIEWFTFCFETGGFVCAHIAETARHPMRVTLSAETALLFAEQTQRVWSGERLETVHNATTRLGLTRFQGLLLQYLLDGLPASRRIAFEMLSESV